MRLSHFYRVCICRVVAGLTLLLGIAAPARAAQARVDPTWRDHDRAADSAAAHGDWRRYIRHLEIVDSALSRRSGVTMALARGYAQLGDTGKAFSLLQDFADAGLTRNINSDPAFASLRTTPRWTTLSSAIAANATRALPTPAAFALGDSGFVAEDVAYDARRGRFLFSGIRGRRVIAREASGAKSNFAAESSAGPLWAVMGLGIDSLRDRLWVSTVADDRIPGLPPGARPRASVLRVRLEDGSVERRFDFPDDELPHEPGDLALAPNGDLVISDGRHGSVYLIRRERDTLEILLPPGTLNSPQEPAVSLDNRLLLVPDYLGGIAIIPRGTSQSPGARPSVTWLKHKRSIVLNGIDGLKWTGPRALIAVQNGVVPNRVVRLTLDASRSEAIRLDVLAQGPDLPDPTHGIVVKGEYYVIARAGWYALDARGELRSDVKLLPSLISKIHLSPVPYP